MTLMAGPIDPRESPTEVNEFAVSKSLDWFENSVICPCPGAMRGGGRRVYPGFLQLAAFMAMNMDRHRDAHRKLYDHLAKGETAEAEKIKTFYDEYFAVLDLTEEFYHRDHRPHLPEGRARHRRLHVSRPTRSIRARSAARRC